MIWEKNHRMKYCSFFIWMLISLNILAACFSCLFHSNEMAQTQITHPKPHHWADYTVIRLCYISNQFNMVWFSVKGWNLITRPALRIQKALGSWFINLTICCCCCCWHNSNGGFAAFNALQWQQQFSHCKLLDQHSKQLAAKRSKVRAPIPSTLESSHKLDKNHDSYFVCF